MLPGTFFLKDTRSFWECRRKKSQNTIWKLGIPTHYVLEILIPLIPA